MYIDNKQALLDKVQFGNIFILGFKDKKALLEMGVLEDNPNAKIKYNLPNGDSFTRLTIKDRMIDKLFASSSPVGSGNQNFCHMELSIHGEHGNLICYTVDEYFDYLLEVKDHLLQEYGIEADFSDVRFRKMEINRTFKINHEFKAYRRVMQVLMGNLPRSLKRQAEYREVEKDCIAYDTYYAKSSESNKSQHFIEVKFYNKTKQLQKVILLSEEYMRLEFKLTGSGKIKDDIGTNCFAEITDKMINNYFQQQVTKMFINPYCQWVKARNKSLIKTMKELRVKDKRWIINLLRLLEDAEIRDKKPSLLDIEELIPLINELNIKDKDKRYKIKNAFRNQSKKYETVFSNNDNEKLMEILSKIQVEVPKNNGTKVA